MTLPGVFVQTRETAPPRTPDTDTGKAFFVGMTEKGSTTAPVKLRNMNDYTTKLGARVTYGMLYDALQTYFAEGGSVAYVARQVGVTPVLATIPVFDQSGSVNPGDVSFTVNATSPGAWANGVQVIIAGNASAVTVQVTHPTLGLIAQSSSLGSRDAVVSWANTLSTLADFVTFVAGASNELPRAATYTLASGNDDIGTASDATRLLALNLFTDSLGPGQVLAPGVTTTACHQQLLDHAETYNRVALLDAPDSGVVATVAAAAAAVRNYGPAQHKDRRGKMLAPWAVVPGILPGTTRDVPWSAVEAGIIARNDGKGLTPNDNSAGANGQARYALAVKHGPETAGTKWTTIAGGDLEVLSDAGVNVARMMYGGPRGYGLRSLVDPVVDSSWVNFGNARERMLVQALADAIGERYVMRTIDARGLLVGQFRGELEAMLEGERQRNALYGATPDEAFAVNTTANTPTTAAQRKLLATLAIRFSEAAEVCIIELVKVPVDQAVA